MSAELRLIREYIKNLSFESPRAREFMEVGERPALEFDVIVGVTPQSSDLQEVTISLEVHATNEISVIYHLELSYCCLFRLRNIPLDVRHKVLMGDCPKLLFPSLRRIVSDITHNAGFTRLMLDFGGLPGFAQFQLGALVDMARAGAHAPRKFGRNFTMCVAAKFKVLKFTIPACVGLSLFPLYIGAMAQTLQPKQAQPAPSGTPPQPAPEASAPQPTWMVNCTNVAGGFDCRASQTLIAKKTGTRVLTLVVRTTPDARKPVMLIQVPLGIHLPAGVTLQIGKNEAKKLSLQSCNQQGCLTEYAVTDAEVAAMQQEADVKVSVQDQDLKMAPVTLRVPGLGFAAAYAKMK